MQSYHSFYNEMHIYYIVTGYTCTISAGHERGIITKLNHISRMNHSVICIYEWNSVTNLVLPQLDSEFEESCSDILPDP